MDATIISMNSQPLVSAIIIFLNGEKFLEEAINSVIEQTYSNWELLLVDDGSTDNSGAIAIKYVQTWKGKIKYFHHDNHLNKGMSATRNLGIKHARGDYIGFLDADDVWLPDKLYDQLGIFKEHPECGMVYGRTEIWHSWTGNTEDSSKDFFYPLGVKPDSVVYPPKIALLLLENKAQSPTTCNALFKKDIFQRVGLFLEDFRGMFEDATFFSKVGVYLPIYVSDKVWAKYRQHNKSCSIVSEKAKAEEQARYKYLEWFKSYLNTEKNFSITVRLALYKEIFPYRHRGVHSLIVKASKYAKDFLNRFLQR